MSDDEIVLVCLTAVVFDFVVAPDCCCFCVEDENDDDSFDDFDDLIDFLEESDVATLLF